MITSRKPRICKNCEHGHPRGQECQFRTPAALSGSNPKCGCTS